MVNGITTRMADGKILRVREVWQENLEMEMKLILSVVDDYPYVAMDTEFPGVVVRPVGNFKKATEYQYQTLKCNVDMLKLIQLGLTFTNTDGELPTIEGELCIWQFNFREFRMADDIYAQDSIDLLRQAGIDFAKNEVRGIAVQRFGELLMTSGIVLNEDIRWVTFHSGYDFGYLLKVVTCQPLPPTEAEFFSVLKLYFPRLYDIKYLMGIRGNLHGGLIRVAETLQVEMPGKPHLAGWDSLVTSYIFIELTKKYFSGVDGAWKYEGFIYGLSADVNFPSDYFA